MNSVAEKFDFDKIEPLVVLVEDREQARRTNEELLKLRGCKVLSFMHSDDAIKELLSGPSVDLVVTDIDLDGSGHDKSGIYFAKYLKDNNYPVPICGYSANPRKDLTETEKNYLDIYYVKGKQNAVQLNEIFDRLKSIAIKNRTQKILRSIEIAKRIKVLLKSDIKHFEEVKKLIFTTDDAGGIEKVLNESNYSLRILLPSEIKTLKNPILVWLKNDIDHIEAEVYGHPSLYSFGASEEEAIESLVDLMNLFASDIDDQDIEYHENAVNLKNFLKAHF